MVALLVLSPPLGHAAEEPTAPAAVSAPRSKPVLLFGGLEVVNKDDKELADRFVDQLRMALQPIPKLDVRWTTMDDGGETGGERQPTTIHLRCKYEIEAEKLTNEDGANYVHYLQTVQVFFDERLADGRGFSKLSECSQNDMPGDPANAYAYTPKGKLMGKTETVSSCVQRAAKEFALAIANGLPLCGTLVTEDTGLSVDLGEPDGLEKGLKFDLYRPGLSNIEPASGMKIEKAPVKIGEIEVTAPGETTTGFKVRKINKGEKPQLGDLVIERARTGGFFALSSTIR
jgi:hypothetical protein